MVMTFMSARGSRLGTTRGATGSSPPIRSLSCDLLAARSNGIRLNARPKCIAQPHILLTAARPPNSRAFVGCFQRLSLKRCSKKRSARLRRKRPICAEEIEDFERKLIEDEIMSGTYEWYWP